MKNEQKRKKIKKILIAALVVSVILALVFAGNEFINRARVTSFEIETNNLTCTDKDQIGKYLASLNIRYFLFKQNELEENLKKKFFCIGKIETRLSYPDKLKLVTWGREALFAVKEVNTSLELNPVVSLPDVPNEATQSTKEAEVVKIMDRILSDLKQSSESGVSLVDNEGVIFEKNPGSFNVPMLSILGTNVEIGREIPDGVVEKAGLIYSKLREIGTPVDNIIIIGDRLVVDSKPRIIFSLKKRIDYQTASLQLILAQAKMNPDPNITGSHNIESIDLRFDKPVAVYIKK